MGVSTTKIGEHIPCGYSMSTIWAFDHIEINILYIVEEIHKNLIDFEKKKMLPLTKKELKPYQDAKVCYIYGKRFIKKFSNAKNYRKVRDHCRYTGNKILWIPRNFSMI